MALERAARKKKPLYIAVAFALAALTLAYAIFQTWATNLDDNDEYVAKRETHIVNYARLGETLGRVGMLEDLRRRLVEARDSRYIDFFILQYKGEPLFYGTADGNIGTLDREFAPTEDLVRLKDKSYVTVPLQGELLLTIGINKSETGYLKEQVEKYFDVMVEQAVTLILISLCVFMYYFRDIFQFLNILNSRDKRRFKKIKTKSRESEILAQGLAGYEQTVDALTLQNQTLGRQVLPSLKKEILSGRTPPYDFDCTMVRTDINNFSSIYNNHDVSEFMKVINSFFQEVSHIVSRYNGLIHEFVGDEVIFYFKDEDHSNSFMIALAAIRDINDAASQYHKRTMKAYGYPFTVKSSLAHGTIRFGPLVNGYSMAGSVLIETVRILSHVVEKDGNVVYFDSANLKRVSDVFDVAEASRVQLKGFSGTRTLYSCRSMKPVADVLKNLSEESVGDLAYYRGDSDLCEILEHLRKNTLHLPTSVVNLAIQELRDFRVTKSDTSIRDQLLSWMEELSEAAEGGNGKAIARILSAAAMLAMNLISQDNYDQDVESRFAQFLSDNDKRVVANVVEVMTHFKSEMDDALVERILSHDNNRVAANALVHEGVKDLSPFVIKRLKKMLASKNASYIASALYAVGELAAYHRGRDVVYYSTHIEFLQLVQALPSYAIHDETMVRRQALIAAKKSADPRVLEAILKKASHHGADQFRAEVREHIGDPAYLLADMKKAA